MGDAEHTEPATTHTAREQAALEKRVHVDLPRVRPEDMVTTQDVDPPQDPRGGRDTDTEFMLRNAGW
ncbi:MAG TPA: heme biosynthesis protein HemY [Ornithinibacter sp.]|nr:heme biosynthesis protein HemY [Ornithinibacter sp.]